MIQSPRYRSFLRSLYTAILQTNLSSNELRQLAEELRRGRLPDELAYMLDKASDHFQVADRRDDRDDLVHQAERLIKEKKIARTALINVIRSFDDPSLSAGISTSSVRTILDRFFDSAKASQAKKLMEVLSSLSAPDPYLKGISESRE